MKFPPQLFLIFCLLVFINCSDNISGGPGGQTTNGITATILSSIDSIALDSVSVILRPIDYMVGDSQNIDTLEYSSMIDTFTSSDGTFEIYHILPGQYFLECMFKDSLGIVETLTIDSGNKIINLENIFIKQVGALSGNVDTCGFPEDALVEIFIKGFEKTVTAAIDGSFKFNSLAPWDYELVVNILSIQDTIIKEINKEVFSNTNSEIDTIELYAPFNPFQYLRVRKFLDSMGLFSLSVDSATNDINGQIYKLNLSKLNLTEIGSGICDLDFLKEINFSNNLIEDIPFEMKNMFSLQTVELCFNNFKSFPFGLTTLDSVQKICLDNNSIDSLPNSIVNLKSLIVLDIESNNLTSLPLSISHLTKLTKIDIDSNKVSVLPETMMDSLQYLDTLELTYNNIDTSIFSIEFVQWLDEKSDNPDWILLQN